MKSSEADIEADDVSDMQTSQTKEAHFAAVAVDSARRRSHRATTTTR